MRASTLLLAIGFGPIMTTIASNVGDAFDASNYASHNVIVRDVAVIGGGSSGTYAAINLRKLGQSVVVVEKEDVLGGHTNTYTDPSTGVTVDYGVQAFYNISVTLDFFAHFNVSLVPYAGSNVSLRSADFSTGKPVVFNAGADLTPWAAQLAKYPWLDYSWNVPHPVPADLLLPLGDFITKYNLSSIAYYLYFSAQGLSNPLQQLTVNVMKMVDPAYLAELQGAGLGTAHQNNGEVFVKALAELGSNALLSSTVTAAQRSYDHSSVSLVVKTPSGSKLIKASKLLISIPQTVDNMKPFGLDAKESNVFSQWHYMAYYTLLLNNTGLPEGYEWINANDSSATYNIPKLPGASQIISTRIPGLFYAWYRSPVVLTQRQVEASTIQTIQKLQAAENLTATTPSVVEYRSHTPYKLEVSAAAISNGFYDQLAGLQGYHSTWYTGAALVSHNAGLIWNFTQALLPQIVAAH